MDAFARLVRSLERAGVRFVLIGLAGANYYARSGATLFVTKDRDLLLPLDPDEALAAWGGVRGDGAPASVRAGTTRSTPPPLSRGTRRREPRPGSRDRRCGPRRGSQPRHGRLGFRNGLGGAPGFSSGQSTSPWPVSGTSSSRNVAWDARRTGCSWQRTPRRSGSSPRATSGSSRSARAARADESRGSVVDAVHSDSAGSDFRAEAPPADRAHEGSGGP